MTAQSNPRIKEIQAIWNQYQGLYIIGGVLIGLLLFPLLELIINDLSELLIGLVPEAIGIGFTVFFLDRIYQKREIENLKRRLIGEAGSRSNETAKSAIDWMRREGWLVGENGLLQKAELRYANLEGANLKKANLRRANLQQANLQRTNLQDANLENAHLSHTHFDNASLTTANLHGAYLRGAYFRGASLGSTNFEGAYLVGANLENAYLWNANLTKAFLSRANLTGANLQKATLENASLKGAILPDGKEWTENTDLVHFTFYDDSISNFDDDFFDND